MKKFTRSLLLLLALTVGGSLRAQTMLYLASFNNGQTPNGYLSTSSGDIHPVNSATGGTGGSGAAAISFDNSQYSTYTGTLGTYDSTNTQGTSTNAASYVVSFDIRATNLAANTTATVTPSVGLVLNYDGKTTYTVTGTPIKLTGSYVHYTLNVATLTGSGAGDGSFGRQITDPNYNQTVFQLALNDLGSSAFNAGASTIYLDNLAITQVPEPAWGGGLGGGLVLACAVRPLRRAWSGRRAA